MNIIFMGTPAFAMATLEAIETSTHKLLAVVTQPDKPAGRGREVACSPVKQFAIEKNIPCYQPDKANRQREFIESIRSHAPDIIVVVAYGQILSEEILNIPHSGCINVHASLLPLYRGAAPINWAIIKGDKKTGITIMKMDKGMDTGDILQQSAVEIQENDNALSLHNKLALLGSQEAISAIDTIENRTAHYKKQDSRKATFAPRLKKDDGLINWNEETNTLVNKIRGLVPWPCAYTFFKGFLLKIWDVEISGLTWEDPRGKGMKPGTIIIENKRDFLIVTKDGLLKVKELQMQNKRKMRSKEFIQGHYIKTDDVLGGPSSF